MFVFLLFSDWSSTQRLGVISYAASSLVCIGLALRRGSNFLHKPKSTGIALFSAILQILMVADLIAGWRLAIHNALAGVFVQYNLYQIRHPFQAGSLLVFGAIFFFALQTIVIRFRFRPGAKLAATGLLLSVTLWVLEIISLHATDHALYYLFHGRMVIAYLWLLAAAITAVGASFDALSMNRKRAPRS
ncbi:hypothetical protein [Silvibacterium sp.]|uniref:hypothetical protein n=1 Tax=Silvibacterium sp. TaxID=1964179 RepID=UPI0039E4F7AD